MTIARYLIGFFVGGFTLTVIASLNQPVGVGILFSAAAMLVGLESVMALEKVTEAAE